MAITYTWAIKGLTKTTDGGFDDAIIGTRWECTGTDADGVTGTFTGATPFNLASADPNNYIPYNELTETQVLGWIKSSVSGSSNTSYFDHIESRIKKAIDDKKGVVVSVDNIDLPWLPTSGSNSGSIVR
jgi:hypothetical protein